MGILMASRTRRAGTIPTSLCAEACACPGPNSGSSTGGSAELLAVVPGPLPVLTGTSECPATRSILRKRLFSSGSNPGMVESGSATRFMVSSESNKFTTHESNLPRPVAGNNLPFVVFNVLRMGPGSSSSLSCSRRRWRGEIPSNLAPRASKDDAFLLGAHLVSASCQEWKRA